MKENKNLGYLFCPIVLKLAEKCIQAGDFVNFKIEEFIFNGRHNYFHFFLCTVDNETKRNN